MARAVWPRLSGQCSRYRTSILPPSLNCDEPHPALQLALLCQLSIPLGAPVQQGATASRRQCVRGFGGQCQRHPGRFAEETSLNWARPYYCPAQRNGTICLGRRFTGTADPQLRQVAAALENNLHPNLAELSAAVLSDVDRSQPCKLALLATDLEQLRNALPKCISRLNSGATDFVGDRDVFFATAAAESSGRGCRCISRHELSRARRAPRPST